jgi:isoleucyl-tRNA synthetase
LKISKKEIRKSHTKYLLNVKLGIKYEQLMPLVLHIKMPKMLLVISGDFVTIEDGTGIVHTSTFGADDAKREAVPEIPNVSS